MSAHPAEAGLVHQRHLPQAPAMAELLASFDDEFRGTQQQGEAEALRAAQEAEADEASKLALPTVSELPTPKKSRESSAGLRANRVCTR